jgi:ABC-2 type transport system ATP-binding protein
MASDNVIVLKNLTKDYGEGRGTFGLTFDVPRGSVFGYCGPNGAGKTTTIRQMMGFLKPDEGSATLFGYDSWKDAQTIKQYVGYIPGEIAFPDVATGTDFLRIQANMIGLTDMSPGRVRHQENAVGPDRQIKVDEQRHETEDGDRLRVHGPSGFIDSR